MFAIREGHKELFALLKVSEVPLVIFSAGIGGTLVSNEYNCVVFDILFWHFTGFQL